MHSRMKKIMEEQEQVRRLQGQVADLKKQVSKLMQVIRELARGKEITVPPTLPITTPPQ